MGISPHDFERMQARVNRRGRRSSAALRSDPIAGVPRHEIVIGIDPSLRGTGFGIVHFAKPRPVALAFGAVSCPAAWDRSRCLLRIVEVLREEIRRHRPTGCAIEGLFYAQNLKTALIMGEAGGASLVAAAEAGLEIFEIAPRKVKQAIVGYGAAQKTAVAKMVQRLLGLGETPQADAADALALALAYEQASKSATAGPSKRI